MQVVGVVVDVTYACVAIRVRVPHRCDGKLVATDGVRLVADVLRAVVEEPPCCSSPLSGDDTMGPL